MRRRSRSLGLVWLSFAAACSAEHGSQPDAPVPPDLRPPITGPVSLRIAIDDTPMVGVTVLFQDFGSQNLATLQTDATGSATLTMRAGGFVTAVNPFGPPAAGAPDDVRTFAAVQPGDELRLHGHGAAQAITLTITGPRDPGAASYELHTSCGAGALVAPGTGLPTGQLTLRGCGGTADLLLESFDATGAPLRSVFQAGVAVADAGSVTLTGAYEPVPSVAFSYSSVPASCDHVDVRAVIDGARGPLVERSTTVPISTGSGTGARSLALPAFAGALLTAHSTLERSATSLAVHHIIDRSDAGTGAFIDLFRNLLPELVDGPVFELPGNVTWTESVIEANVEAFQFESGVQPLNLPDFVVLGLHVVRGTERTWDWRIVVPYAGPFIALPKLSVVPDGFSYSPQGGDTVTLPALTTAKVAGGYDAVRASVLDDDPPEHLLGPTFGSRITLEQLRPAP
jgi:hypothetical protein